MIRSSALSVLTLLILHASSLVCAGEDSPPVKPFGGASAEKTLCPVVVEMSDGRHLPNAVIEYPAGKMVTVFDPSAGAAVDVTIADIAHLSQAIEKEGVEKEWRWKEGGSDEKVFTDRTYPWRVYSITIVKTDGTRVSGRLLKGIPLWVEYDMPENGASEGEDASGDIQSAKSHIDRNRMRLLLQPKAKGGFGDSVESLVYVKSIECSRVAPSDKGSTAATKTDREENAESKTK